MPTAKWVLPTPGGPRSNTLSVSAMNRQVASSLITLGSMEGWNLKSKLSRVFWKGKRASLHGGVPLVLGGNLAAENVLQEIAVGEVLLARLLQERGQFLREADETQPLELVLDPF